MRGCNEVVTVWNRWKNPENGAESFVRHVLPVLCKWKVSVKRGEYRNESAGSGRSASAGISMNLSVVVPFSEKYIPYRLWKEMDETSRKRLFTLNVSDLIARGAHNIEITGSPPFTENQVRHSLSNDCAIIAAFADNSGLPDGSGRRNLGAHFKVGCFYGFRGW